MGREYNPSHSFTKKQAMSPLTLWLQQMVEGLDGARLALGHLVAVHDMDGRDAVKLVHLHHALANGVSPVDLSLEGGQSVRRRHVS